ncbi:MAG TPA: DUF6328 family protein [Pseudonocardiaceae bacterium]|jgi:hypothetical protein|nr:DUF6328 family protein [Pseudonocardiaceae bacterium]
MTDTESGESEQARLARNMAELLQELRVAQAGVQILFAFLLSVTFSARFGQATSLQRVTLIVTILLTTLSAVLLMAPVAWHRLYFRQGRRFDVIRWGSRCALGGLLLLAAAMSGAVLVTTATVVGSTVAITLACCTAVVFGTVWLLLPISRRHR